MKKCSPLTARMSRKFVLEALPTLGNSVSWEKLLHYVVVMHSKAKSTLIMAYQLYAYQIFFQMEQSVQTLHIIIGKTMMKFIR